MESNVDLLLVKYEKKIKRLSDLFDERFVEGGLDYVDDIWFLRWILSNKKVKNCIDPIEKALEFRIKYKKELELVMNGGDTPGNDQIRKYLCGVGQLQDVRHSNGGPIYIVRSALGNPTLLMNNVPAETLFNWMIFERERMYWICDKHTRETRVLTKVIFINDFTGVRIWQSREKRFFAVLGNVSKASENFFPQLLEKNIMINCPWWFSAMFKAAKFLFPARMLEKISICPARGTEKAAEGDIQKCPFFRDRFSGDTSLLPDFLGGSLTCPANLRDITSELFGEKSDSTSDPEMTKEETEALFEKTLGD